jgi:hypothetical protein
MRVDSHDLAVGIGYVADADMARAADSTTGSSQVQLRATYMAWDDEGKTKDIQGITPVLKQSNGPDLKITSDLNIALADSGIITLSVEGKGQIKLRARCNQGEKLMWVPNP